ncbi:hypothetical protein ACLD02_06385 [Alloalcanivorax sp. C16-2]|uniref:hypothetical protein n=1 Tax=Alloalcanivorax TaxID=3020832 RepID=UPI0019326A2E|nr:hypothetical protein [Alloalcanivorax marinus]MBL7251421.1 hypothetical protein [Alloalcanivorax marinus]
MSDQRTPWHCAHGRPYDPFPVLDALAGGDPEALDTLWRNLVRDGAVGTASYAAVPRLVDAGQLALVAAIELGREEDGAPSLPADLRTPYLRAVEYALERVPGDSERLQAWYSLHAARRGHRELARALQLMDRRAILDLHG